ncbi:hypothetical protein [Pseudomonas amygdali]|uniref:hypothetical protein n=1 Tax=Pseudomonas amygdali TaxID=47877 RepID=UPI001F37FDF4|nr:hypothetical protein [Pseudomonas amygdali]
MIVKPYQTKWVVVTLLGVMLLVAELYNFQFGFNPSDEKADWGTFGDYFGGVLNPIIGMLGFVGILNSLHMQQNQLVSMKRDQLAEEVLDAVKDIDARMTMALAVWVGTTTNGGPFAKLTDLLVSHMAFEGRRGAKALGDSAAYAEFIKTCNMTGSVNSVPVNEIRRLVIQLRDLVRHHPSHSRDEYSPVLFYYVSKAAELMPMLEDIGDMPAQVAAFYRDKRWTGQRG